MDFGQHFNQATYEKFLPCWQFAQEVQAVLANPQKLNEYFSPLDSIIKSRQQFHLIRGLVNGNFVSKEGYYLPALRERITDQELEETRKALPELGKHFDSLIESLKIEQMTLAGYIKQSQTEDYQAKLHLVFGLMMYSREITAEMLELLEELTHLISDEEFAILFSLYVLYSEESGRRYYNRE